MLVAIALLQHGQFAAMVLEPLERGLHRQFAEQRRDLGRSTPASICAWTDSRGFRLDAFRLGRGQRGIPALEFSMTMFWSSQAKPTRWIRGIPGVPASPFPASRGILRTRPQPFDGFQTCSCAFQILLDIGAGQRVGQIAGELRIGMFHAVDHPLFSTGVMVTPLAGDLRFLLGRPAGQEIRAGRQPALLQRRGHHLAAVEGVDVGVEVFQFRCCRPGCLYFRILESAPRRAARRVLR